MSLASLFIATAALAINFGWQKADDGYEYLVQLEPETLRLMQDGLEVPIDSNVPEGVQPIRRVRIVVGKAELPREPIADAGESGSDEAIERTANWRPGDETPPPPGIDGRYPTAPPAAAPPVPNNAMTQPLTDVNNYLQQGFESGVNGLQKTGDTIRGAVDSVNSTVQDQFQKGKEMLVGPSPTATSPAMTPVATTPYGAPAPPTFGTNSAWPTTASNANSATAPLSGLPAPPLAPSGATATSAGAPNAFGGLGPQIPDSSGNSTAAQPTNLNGNRMVPIEPQPTATTAPAVPAWKPDWPEPPTPTTTTAFSDWPAPNATTPASSPKPTTANQPPKSEAPPTTSTSPNDADVSPSASNAQDLGSWGMAIVMLAASVGANFYLFLNYVDVRNKYRAALRRTSRSFGRSPAGA